MSRLGARQWLQLGFYFDNDFVHVDVPLNLRLERCPQLRILAFFQRNHLSRIVDLKGMLVQLHRKVEF